MATKTKSVKYELIDIPRKTTEFVPTGRYTKAKWYNDEKRRESLNERFPNHREICGTCHRPYGDHMGSYCPAYQKIQFIK